MHVRVLGTHIFPLHEYSAMLKKFSLSLSRDQVHIYNPWYYPVEVNGEDVKLGVGTTSAHDYLLAWQEYRDGVLGDALLDKIDFEDKTLRDYACNCGYWGLRAAERGLKYYVGIEGREVFIRQGEQLWGQAEKRCPYQFILGNVVARAASPPVDISFCVGILYHLPDWQSLLREIAESTNEVIVIETRWHHQKASRSYPGDLTFNRINDVGVGPVKMPSLSEMSSILEETGWPNIEVLENKNRPAPVIPESEWYNDGNSGRVALIARR